MWQQTQKRTVYYSSYHETEIKFSYFNQKSGTVRQKIVKKNSPNKQQTSEKLNVLLVMLVMLQITQNGNCLPTGDVA